MRAHGIAALVLGIALTTGTVQAGQSVSLVLNWTPAADCSDKIAGWSNDGPPVELVVYPGAHHGFYYSQLQPGMTLFGHWLEYNGEAADNANHRLRRFLDRHLE